MKRNLSLNRGRGGAAPRERRPGDGGAAPSIQGKGGGRSPRRPHKGLYWASLYSSGPSFFSSMTKFSSLERARVIGPEGGAWGGGASGGAGEGVAGVDVLVVSSSVSYHLGAFWIVWLPYETRCKRGPSSAKVCATKSHGNFSQRTHPIHPIGP